MARPQSAAWFAVLGLACIALGNLDADERQCKDKLKGLTVCASFVSGVDKRPSNECCTRLVGVRATYPKCLCVLLIESARPSAVGPPVNQTHSLEMIQLCKIQGKVSDCPVILDLPPNSPEARTFDMAGSANASTSPISSSGISGSSRFGVWIAAAVISSFVLQVGLNI